MHPEFKPVTSSNIAEIAHHGDTLHVRFHNGSVWKYSNVDQKLYNDMLLAGSIGKFFNEHIKRFKPAEKVDLSAKPDGGVEALHSDAGSGRSIF